MLSASPCAVFLPPPHGRRVSLLCHPAVSALAGQHTSPGQRQASLTAHDVLRRFPSLYCPADGESRAPNDKANLGPNACPFHAFRKMAFGQYPIACAPPPHSVATFRGSQRGCSAALPPPLPWGCARSLCAEMQGQSSHSQAKTVRLKVGAPSSAGRFAVAKSRQPSASSVSVGNEGKADKCTEIAILKHTKSYTNKPHLII